jgi:hypothetical protein
MRTNVTQYGDIHVASYTRIHMLIAVMCVHTHTHARRHSARAHKRSYPYPCTPRAHSHQRSFQSLFCATNACVLRANMSVLRPGNKSPTTVHVLADARLSRSLHEEVGNGL